MGVACGMDGTAGGAENECGQISDGHQENFERFFHNNQLFVSKCVVSKQLQNYRPRQNPTIPRNDDFAAKKNFTLRNKFARRALNKIRFECM